MDEYQEDETSEQEDPVPAYRISESVSYLVKCIDDGYPDDWVDLNLEDWVEKGKWYRVLAIIGSKQLAFAEFIVWDLEEKYIVQASQEIFTFPSSMFDIKDSFMLNNN